MLAQSLSSVRPPMWLADPFHFLEMSSGKCLRLELETPDILSLCSFPGGDTPFIQCSALQALEANLATTKQRGDDKWCYKILVLMDLSMSTLTILREKRKTHY
mmetsp:Transcript_72710/g.144130  ORF Transcript_72710/g.144130 Transcript_72710/m.144130 type:complete len:103 (+) Transcript_72710:263-571(+)